ncbi:MAG: hypothetical protein FAF03_02900 [Epsilonproteobacteria bacterium]|nr:hypothetical protein [Campylobacterota bacterium]
MNLKTQYPQLFSKLSEEVDEVRYLVVVDKNFNDVDSDEFDAIDPEDYNYLVYITERLQDVMGEKLMVAFIKQLEAHKDIALFYLSEVDLYGIQTDLEDEAIEKMVLETVESVLA